MKAKLIALCFSIIAFCCTNLQSQGQDLQRYTEYTYMKVKPENRAEYIKLEKAWKKIHAARKEAGRLDDWSLMELISPRGSENDYDFVTRDSYLGKEKYAATFSEATMPQYWQSLLTIEEIDLVLRTEQIRTIVKNETWNVSDVVWAADATATAEIYVFNYFKVPLGKTMADHTKIEIDIWKPIHQARVNANQMKGWVALDMMMPMGAFLPYSQATIDVYTDMNQFLNPWVDDYFKKVHPTKKMDDLLKLTRDNSTLIKK